MPKTIESKVADTILQRPKTVVIGGATYNVAPPSTATLILVSGLISQLPKIETDKKDIVTETFRIAKDCGAIGDIMASIVLGAKAVRKDKRLLSIRRKRLARQLLDIPPSELQTIFLNLLPGMEMPDFFGLTVSLIEVNMTKQTKETGTTASGQ